MKWKGCAAALAGGLLGTTPSFAQTAAPAGAEPEEPRVRWVAGAPLHEWQPPSPAPAETKPPEWTLSGPHFALSLERMSSMLAWTQRTTIGRDQDMSGFDVSLLTAGTGRTASAIPRVGFDTILANGMSLGVGLGYLHASATTYEHNGEKEIELASAHTFLIAPRAGMLLDLSSWLGLWLRAGFTYTSASDGGPTSFWNFNLEPQLVAVAAPRVAFTLGAVLDSGFAGETKASDDSPSHPYRSGAYGLTFGATALF